MFVEYLLELYMNHNLKGFVGKSRKSKRINLTLSAIKLACHFLCPEKWDISILKYFQFDLSDIDKYSRKLFAILLNK